jgi:hypothetical protein
MLSVSLHHLFLLKPQIPAPFTLFQFHQSTARLLDFFVNGSRWSRRLGQAQTKVVVAPNLSSPV